MIDDNTMYAGQLAVAGEKKPKTGNGKATIKTATAAANAARLARDEARSLRDETWVLRKACEQLVRDADVCVCRCAIVAIISVVLNALILAAHFFLS